MSPSHIAATASGWAKGVRAPKPITAPEGRAAAVATAGTGTSRGGLLSAWLTVTLLCCAWGAVKGSTIIGMIVGVPSGALMAAHAASLRISVGPDWLAARSFGCTRWVDLSTLTSAVSRRPARGGARLELRDSSGRRFNVDLRMLTEPAVRAALGAAVRDPRAAGFDDTFRALLAVPRSHTTPHT